MVPIFKFRPHHFLCTLGFEGKGYSEEFVRNFSRIAHQLRVDPAGDSIQIQVVGAADSICQPCPNREGRGCASGEKIDLLDKEHALILGVKPGDTMSWKQAKDLLADKMTIDAFNRACAACSWKSMGVCEAALRKLKSKPSPLLLVLGLSLFLTLNPIARASVPPEDISQARNIEELRNRLLSSAVETKSKSKKKAKKKPAHPTASLKKAYQSLQKQKYKEALPLATALEKDKKFADYGYWIAGQALLADARYTFRQGNFKEAEGLAQTAISRSMRIIADHPYSPFGKTAYRDVATAELIRGGALCGQKKWGLCMDQMENAFQRISNVHGGNGDLGGAPAEFLEAYGNACAKADTERCNAWMVRLASVFPKNSPEYKALMRNWPEGVERPKSQAIGGRLSKSYRAPDLDQASYEVAMAPYFEKKYSDAIRLLQQFLDDYPRSPLRFRAQYWLGRAFTQEKKEEEAKKIFENLSSESPLTFHGLLASFSINKEMGASIAATIPVGVSREPGLTALELQRLERAELLLQGGLPTLAAYELKDLKPREAHSNSFLIYLAMLDNEAGNHLAAFWILTELIQRGYQGVYTTAVLKFIFPTPFLELVREAAEENKIDPVLLLSLIKQESSFEANAVSVVGAQGLTQVMPGTALDVVPGIQRSDLADTRINVKIGAKYLAKVLNKFNGNIALALAGYNAGPYNVEKWIKAAPQRTDMLEFIESIPFRETREYVGSIIRNYFWYTHFFRKETTPAVTLTTAPSPTPSQGPPSTPEGITLDYFWANFKPEAERDVR